MPMGEMHESSREEREIAGLRRELHVVKNEAVRLAERAEKAEAAAMSMSLANRGLLERAERAEANVRMCHPCSQGHHDDCTGDCLSLCCALEAEQERAEKAERERDVARQGLWEIAGIAGADLDGDATPAALVYPSVEEFATEAVRELRTTCDEAVRGHAAAERELAEAVELLRRHQEAHGLARDHAGGPDTAAQEWRYGRDALLSRHQETSE